MLDFDTALSALRSCVARQDAAGLEAVLGGLAPDDAGRVAGALRPDEHDAFLLLSPVRLLDATELLPPAERARVVASVQARWAAQSAAFVRRAATGDAGAPR